MDLFQNSYFSLFVIVALGYMLGSIKIKGVSLDVSAVIFIALLFGHFGVLIPADIQNFGMILFIFTIGIQAGPGFLDSFKSKGRDLAILTVILILSAGLVSYGCSWLFDIDSATVTGLLAGALTSTPGLAASIEATGSSLSSIGYGIAYPFGVIGVILFVKLLPKLMRANIPAIEKKFESEQVNQYPALSTRVFRVENVAVIDRTIGELKIRTMTGVNVSRIMHNNIPTLPTPNTKLMDGDMIKAVGTVDSLDRVELLIGPEVNQDLPLSDKMEIEQVLLTNTKLVNETLGSLNLLGNYGATATRVRRSGIEIAPSPDLKLKFGDKLTIAAPKDGMSEIAHIFGNDDKAVSSTNFFPIAAGIVLGVLFGKINIALGDGLSFSPGLTGGVLLVAIILSGIGKTGPIMWTMSGNSNTLLRQLGLIMFLAGVGTSAGQHIVATFEQHGITLFLVGGAITLIPMIIATLIAHFVFKMNILYLLGALTGGMTSTPGLAACDSMTKTNMPTVAYATVYPIALVMLIVVIQVLALL
ncbi:MAG: aspartate:alanine exchanger family transporter [Bacteroidales bacterium]|nr:aspartate:alanine exchanger family transporter [Bacteroidales bacterium]